MPLQIRRGTEAERLVLATAPVEGELIWITDDQKLYIGDGATLAKNLTPVTGYNDSDAVDATAAALLAGTHTNIAFTYAGGAINAEVEFADFDGVVKAAAFNGSVVADDSTELVNAVDGTFNLDGTIKGHIVPDADEAYDIGSASYKFKDLYLSGSSIKLGNAEITSSGNAIVLPEGSYILGGYNSSIVADDSSVIVNTATKEITGIFTGDLTGSVFGDNSATLVNGVDNSLSTGDITLRGNTIDVTLSTNLVIGDENDSSFISFDLYSNAVGKTSNIYGSTNQINAPGTSVFTSRGTWRAPTVVQSRDNLKTDLVWGWDGSNYIATGGINVIADPWVPVSVGNVPGTLVLGTYTNGDVNNGRGIIIDSRGYCSINQANQPREMLDVGGNAIIDGTITGDLIGSVFTDGSTMVIDGTNGNIMYSPAVSGDWAGTAPTTIQEAIDRIAAALGPIA